MSQLAFDLFEPQAPPPKEWTEVEGEPLEEHFDPGALSGDLETCDDCLREFPVEHLLLYGIGTNLRSHPGRFLCRPCGTVLSGRRCIACGHPWLWHNAEGTCREKGCCRRAVRGGGCLRRRGAGGAKR